MIECFRFKLCFKFRTVIWTSERFLSIFVPKHDPVTKDEVSFMNEYVGKYRKIFALTGAGISTESGVPDYRSEEVGLYARSNHKPIEYKDFIKDEALRIRYWARNYVGFENFASIKPNLSHYTLAEWEKRNRLLWILTQNVDRLHQKAGSQKVTEIHGSGFEVKCLNVRKGTCDFGVDRFAFQKVLDSINPELCDKSNLNNLRTVRPDGDIDLSPKLVKNFEVPSCPKCNGILKPDIIFFGDNVPTERIEFGYQQLADCDSLLVIGSSLFVFSGYRYVLKAHEMQLPIVIINIGPSRADKLSGITFIRKRAGELLPLIDLEHDINFNKLSNKG